MSRAMALLLLGVACSRGAPVPPAPVAIGGAMDALDHALEAMSPPTPENVAQTTGIQLTAGPTPGNGLYTTFAGSRGDARPFTKVELRVGPKGALLILDVASDFKIDLKSLRAHRGTEQNLTVPTPHQPADAPLYLVYNRPWGTLSFGFTRDAEARLVSVVLDAIAK